MNMTRKCQWIFLALLLLAPSASAATRRRAVPPPAASDDTPAGWLTNHAYRLTTTEADAPLGDLEPLRIIVGTAYVIGLGDGTHGTHEFFNIKLRAIKFLVREMGFTTVAMEAPFADFTRLNDYILGGIGDPRSILLHREIGYWFWASEEIVALIEWMRNYNQTRGDRPPVEIAGFDVEISGAPEIVVEYLNKVDPPAAAAAKATYDACQFLQGVNCTARMEAVRADLVTRESELVARTIQRDFDTALQAASVAAAFQLPSSFFSNLDQYFGWRDQKMATNAALLQSRRSSNGRIILWAHQEHLTKTTGLQEVKPMGKWLEEKYSRNLVVVGSCAGEGTFTAFNPSANKVVVSPLLPVGPDAYESYFRSAGIPLLLIPLRGPLPEWLAAMHHLRGASGLQTYDRIEDLKQKLDAILYIDQTTPSHNFW